MNKYIIKYLLAVLLFNISGFIYSNNIIVTTTSMRLNEICNQLEDKGKFIEYRFTSSKDIWFINLGRISDIRNFNSAFRNKSCWMIPKVGKTLADVPSETQFLLIQKTDKSYIMMIPLVNNSIRCSLEGTSKGLQLIAETGDSLSCVNTFQGMYLLKGSNPYAMIKQASSDICNRFKTFKLRINKPIPWIVDRLGWCSWEALRTDMSEEKLLNVASHFKKEQIPFKYLLIDNGWLSENKGRMTNIEPNKIKFPHGFLPMITKLKHAYDFEKVIIWMSLWGPFGGLQKGAFPDLEISTKAVPVKRMLDKFKNNKEENVEEVATVGNVFYPGLKAKDITIPKFAPFYDRVFDLLRREGADGVKIDAMTWVESVGHGKGGRVTMMKDMMDGLEKAACLHFNSELLNCSSCSNDYLFNSLVSNLTRSSGDFFPNKPESHGFHIYTNAVTSFWMGEIILPDWDMFQSGHIAGKFHAAARAISGGPVYTTEKIGTEDKTVLSKLSTKNGLLPRCMEPGKICESSLFTDIKKDGKAIKIFNTNRYNGIVGAFNCSYDLNNEFVTETIYAHDIVYFNDEEYAVWDGQQNKLSALSASDGIAIKLGLYGFNLFTFSPIKNGFAPIGMVDKYNPGGLITELLKTSDTSYSLKLMGGGDFVAFAKKCPKRIHINGKEVSFDYNKNKLLVRCADNGPFNLFIEF